MPGNPASKTISRRKALGLIAVTAGGGAFLPASAFAQATSPYSGLALFMQGGGVCTLTPETTEGPFYFDPKLERADIAGGRDGIPLSIKLQVVDQNCMPIENARVDLWHCDAKGHYSGYPGQGDGRDVDTTGQAFFRGWLRTGTDGIVVFGTIYPGWYRGRTTHIHFKVFSDEGSVATGQMFFPDDLSAHIYATAAPYTERAGKRDTLNKDDGILNRAGASVHTAVRETVSAYEALMVIAVQAG